MNASAVKSQIRDSIRQQRMLLTEEQIQNADKILADEFINIEDEELRKLISSAETVALYKAVRGELACDKIAEFFYKNGRTVCYPKVKGDVIEFFEVTDPESQLSEGAYGILEPKSTCRKVYPKDISLMLVPAVAYTDDGYRLGQGGGYYDRWLNSAAANNEVPFTVGVCYDFQMYSALPVEKHDYAVDMVLCVVGEE